jgi:hypothetical protein
VYEKVDKLLNESNIVKSNGPEEYNKELILQQINDLDNLITRLMLYSEKKCCKKKERALWSPTLQQSNLTIQYWNVLTKCRRQGIRADHRINHIKGRMLQSIRDIIDSTNLLPKQALKAAIKHHKEILKNSHKLREEYL